MTKLMIPVARTSFCMYWYQLYTKTLAKVAKVTSRARSTYGPETLKDVEVHIVLGQLAVDAHIGFWSSRIRHEGIHGGRLKECV